MAFKRITGEGPAPESPQALFQDLKGRKVAGLLDQQGEVLRNYMRALEEPDIAVQMPTGSGKTLVGLLIAEWRRRKFGERALYLCPTNQLVMQVATSAVEKFALNVAPLTGRKRDYPAATKSAYLHRENVAVTSYSALFNSAPFFEDPDFILLDDVHSAENYVASNWSLEIEKASHPALFDVLVSVFSNVLGPDDLAAIRGTRSERWDRDHVQMIPTPSLLEVAPALREALDEHCESDDLFHRWNNISACLDACHVYISPRGVLIRPLIPPTWTHLPFANAKQRVYMSATLGEGGDLERVTGRAQVHRLPLLDAYVKRGVGRRFFIFPERSLEPDQCRDLVTDLMREVPRTLYLVPNSQREVEIGQLASEELGAQIYSGGDLERSKAEFVATENAVCVAAGRYDGIDLAGDDCRLLVVDNLPSATNLQERFFVQRMAANALLSDRIRTRVIQAFGRCTRADTDHAAVVVLGEAFQKLLASSEREHLHPELQSEIEFGSEQSRGRDPSEFLENFRIFLEHTKEWDAAEADIRTRREEATVTPREELAELQASVAHEIEYQQWMWDGNYANAVGCARRVLGCLNHSALRGYRGLWQYLAGSAAWIQGTHEPAAQATAREHFAQAARASRSIPWLHRLARLRTDEEQPGERGAKAAIVVERMYSQIESFGLTNDSSFVAEERFILENLRYVDPPATESEEQRQARSNRFEEAQRRLGMILGYSSGNAEDDGAPDPWWIVDSELAFVFEDHVGAMRGSRISVTKARQAGSHPAWVRTNVAGFEFADSSTVQSILVTPATAAMRGAAVHLRSVAYWDVGDFCEWARTVMHVVRQLRDRVGSVNDETWRSEAIELLSSVGATPEALLERVRGSMATEKLPET